MSDCAFPWPGLCGCDGDGVSRPAVPAPSLPHAGGTQARDNWGQMWGNWGQMWGNWGQMWDNWAQMWDNWAQMWGNRGQMWDNWGANVG